MTPVMVLSDGYIANAAEPWLVPDMASYAPFPAMFHTALPEGGKSTRTSATPTRSRASGSSPARRA